MIDVNRATLDFIAQIGYLDCKFYSVLSELVFIVGQLIKALSFVDMFADGELDINTFGMSICCYATRYMVALRPFDIFLATLEIRYVAYGNESRLRLFLLAPQGISSALAPYRVADISSDASAAHIDVESSCETHDTLDQPCRFP